jgi:chaperonin GroEL
VVPVLEICKRANRPLFLICEDLQPEPLSTMVYNNEKGIVQCAAINMPWMANIQKEQLKDIAAMTGATLIDNEFGLTID